MQTEQTSKNTNLCTSCRITRMTIHFASKSPSHFLSARLSVHYETIFALDTTKIQITAFSAFLHFLINVFNEEQIFSL